MFKLYEARNTVEILDYLKETKLIKANPTPCSCGSSEPKAWRKREGTSDLYWWRCMKCKKFSSCREGSFFSNSKIPIFVIFKLLYHWAMQSKIVDVIELTGVSKETVITYFQAFRELCHMHLDKENFKLGGNGKIVEIKAKHNKGRALKKQQIWVFGMRERGTKKCIFQIVPNRDAKTLIAIICKHIAPGSIVFQIVGKLMIP